MYKMGWLLKNIDNQNNLPRAHGNHDALFVNTGLAYDEDYQTDNTNGNMAFCMQEQLTFLLQLSITNS